MIILKNNMDKIVTVYKVDIGFNVEEEIEKALKEEISDKTLKDAKEVLDIMASSFAKKKIEKTDEDIKECIKIMETEGKIHKDKMNSITKSNTISSVGRVRNYLLKSNKKLNKSPTEKDYYVISNEEEKEV